MKKSYLKTLREYAEKLPEETYTVFNRVSQKEFDRVSNEAKKSNKGFEWIREHTMIKSEVKVNHYRRMKRAFKKGGRELLNKYLSKYNFKLQYDN